MLTMQGLDGQWLHKLLQGYWLQINSFHGILECRQRGKANTITRQAEILFKIQFDVDNERTRLFQSRWFHCVENQQAIDMCQFAINHRCKNVQKKIKKR